MNVITPLEEFEAIPGVSGSRAALTEPSLPGGPDLQKGGGSGIVCRREEGLCDGPEGCRATRSVDLSRGPHARTHARDVWECDWHQGLGLAAEMRLGHFGSFDERGRVYIIEYIYIYIYIIGGGVPWSLWPSPRG